MRISDWSSDVCSSDLLRAGGRRDRRRDAPGQRRGAAPRRRGRRLRRGRRRTDRKSVVSGKSVSVRVDLGGRRIIKKKNNKQGSATTRRQPIYLYTANVQYCKPRTARRNKHQHK